jgi:hypothetical protein
MELVVYYFKVISKENSFYAVTDQGLVGQDLIPGNGKRLPIISTPQCPDLLCLLPSLLSSVNQGCFQWGKWTGREFDHTNLVPRSRMVEL